MSLVHLHKSVYAVLQMTGKSMAHCQKPTTVEFESVFVVFLFTEIVLYLDKKKSLIDL